ncbi:malate dehydrogenase (quinone) [Gordonia sp. ABSL1-1]|uniref:malate dehydrogenase (quinone) n=1 Tax=Gordonia sp. ABSL1-1 TaxID=3053923 RepID=UPI0025737248|nr:malate dehydrogenase (quinone) [Gordonia sp. ABSL1-1]MDL9938496.1 malate dehydrogenase (quinone) [Gordonia sp. ABSL1-1]
MSPNTATTPAVDADVILIGGGIMSATLGAMLSVLQPDWRILLLERADSPADESSAPWNNAGTGHSGYCELNYMPDPTDGTKPADIARQFLTTRQWWSALARARRIDPASFLSAAPHLDVVFGDRDIDYLRRRQATLVDDPWFGAMEFSDDPTIIGEWAPLVTAGREPGEPIAATRHPAGTDVDFGRLTRELLGILTTNGGTTLFGHDVRTIRHRNDGIWTIGGRRAHRQKFTLRGRFVFVGAGGKALTLLQRARIPEVRGYGVLPVGAAFLRCENPAVTARHDGKVYGQADVGAPPMSVPHLDRRVVDGREYLMFGPYATFSTKLLRHGRWTDFFATLRTHNLRVLTAAGLANRDLVAYLVGQLAARPRAKFAQLQRYYPQADPADWELVIAGQRAQLVTPDPTRTGVLQSGTDLVVGADRTIAGLLGASPGASTAVPIMLDLLRRAFPDDWARSWSGVLRTQVPAYFEENWDHTRVADALDQTASDLGIAEPKRPGKS